MAKSSNHEHGNGESEARKALAAVSDALAEWREEVVATTETYTEKIGDQIADAAQALQWPDEIVEASRNHLEEMSKFQLQMLDQMIEAWQEQLKAPMPSHFLSALRMPGPALEGTSAIANFASKPVELWMQAALAWQRNMTSAWTMWSRQAREVNDRARRMRTH
jgi:hypothetical protein